MIVSPERFFTRSRLPAENCFTSLPRAFRRVTEAVSRMISMGGGVQSSRATGDSGAASAAKFWLASFGATRFSEATAAAVRSRD